MKNSKYFTILDDKTVKSLCISESGVKCFVPPEWFNKNVKVIVYYPDHCDFFYTYVKEGRIGTFISIAAMYTSCEVIVRLE